MNDATEAPNSVKKKYYYNKEVDCAEPGNVMSDRHLYSWSNKGVENNFVSNYYAMNIGGGREKSSLLGNLFKSDQMTSPIKYIDFCSRSGTKMNAQGIEQSVL